MIIYRDYKRSEEDDWTLNVQDKLDEYTESVPIYSEYGELVAWKIQKQYD